MKVSPVHFNFNNKSQWQGNTFKNSSNLNNNAMKSALNQSDVFVRLAAASTRDARIEKELTEMGLI